MRFERVLVTGGAGFVGNRVVRLLSEKKIATGVVDNLFVGMPMPAASQYVTPYQIDIRDIAAIDGVFAAFKPDIVVHLAAIHHIPTCERDPHQAMDVNVLGTQVLLDACEKHNVKSFVLASSAAVYDWWDGPLIEDKTPSKPTDVYSTSKIANEGQVATWASRSGGKGVFARIFNVIGHDDPNGHLIPDILKQLDVENGKMMTPVVKLGNTQTLRDYTHANDTASGLMAILEHFDWGGSAEAFNLSRGKEHSVLDLIRVIGNYFGNDIEVVHDASRVRKVDRVHLLGDNTKSRTALQWSAQISLDAAMKDILSRLAPAQS